MQPAATGFLPPESPKPRSFRAAGVMLLISAVVIMLCLYAIPYFGTAPLDGGFRFFSVLASNPEVFVTGAPVSLPYLSLLLVLVAALPAVISGSRGANVGAGVVGIIASFLAFFSVVIMFANLASQGSIEAVLANLSAGFYVMWVNSVLILIAGITGFVGASKVKKSMSSPPMYPAGPMPPMYPPGPMPPPQMGQPHLPYSHPPRY